MAEKYAAQPCGWCPGCRSGLGREFCTDWVIQSVGDLKAKFTHEQAEAVAKLLNEMKQRPQQEQA